MSRLLKTCSENVDSKLRNSIGYDNDAINTFKLASLTAGPVLCPSKHAHPEGRELALKQDACNLRTWW